MLRPAAAVVTCIEADHLDNYGGLAEIEAAFAAFAAQIAPAGCWSPAPTTRGPGRWRPPRGPADPVRTYGEAADADYRVSGVTPRGMTAASR